MTGPPDDEEWSRIAAAWRGSAPGLPTADELRRRVRRQMRRVTLLDILQGVAVVAIPLVLFEMLRHHPEVVSVALSAGVAVHVAFLWGLLRWSRRGRMPGLSGVEYVRAGIEQCRRQLRSIGVFVLLLATESVAFLAYVRQFSMRESFTDHLFAVGAVEEFVATCLFFAAFAAALAWHWRVTRNTLRALRAYLQELDSRAEDAPR